MLFILLIRRSYDGQWSQVSSSPDVQGGFLPYVPDVVGAKRRAMTATIQFDNSYGRLPELFYARQQPTPVAAPQLIRVNRPLARGLGIDPGWLSSEAGCLMLAGNSVLDGADPLAAVYAGHQFGSYNPRLGDGRALLIGEVIARNGERYDLQLKGSGPTPYSRGGDGRAPLGPVLREFIVSEAMHALGIPTTRALAAVASGEPVFRQRALPGAVLTRVASSHIRVGTFQFFSGLGKIDALRQLAEYVIDRHYPASRAAGNPVQALLRAVIRRQAQLIASWQLVGFIHGVMNTDNMLLCGETVDYGPCAFMDSFSSDAVFSSIDHGGRYAYKNQPAIAQWNLSCLAQSLLPLLHSDMEHALELAESALNEFQLVFQEAYTKGFGAKLGLEAVRHDDTTLFSDFLVLLNREQDDFTLAFRRLGDLAAPESKGKQVVELFEFSSAYGPWLERWRDRGANDLRPAPERQQTMHAVNPAFIPRNHLVEEVIRTAIVDKELSQFHSLVEVLTNPFSYRSDYSSYAMPPRQDQLVNQTFCGT